MSNPNRTVYSGPALYGPGIMWVNSVPKAPLAHSAFNEWYQAVHIPDIVSAKPPNSSGCVAAWRYKCQDGSRRRPYLALYSIPDMSFVQSAAFSTISQNHEMLPEGGPSQRYVDFDTRFYRQVQIYEKHKGSNGLGKVIKSTAIQPAIGMEEDFDRWYRGEHLEQVSRMVGWRKSSRYELIFKVQSKTDPSWEEAPKYLAIHEFDEGTEVQRMPQEEWTELTKKMVENAVIIDEGTFELMWGFAEEGVGL
ncbi:hypothetical protein B0J11DRAFT_424236 [Dendryphion nanum]|uniref:Uncharacterized protein n=1 Tax=Dendryphion nanum TaxID=256645 RepID=A0A9P9J060_9PLEO|nr:hypothetical protein B0J11DRAFT_424236 [Dendryphion nanum]